VKPLDEKEVAPSKWVHFSFDISKANTGVVVFEHGKKPIAYSIRHPYRARIVNKDLFLASDYLVNEVKELLRKHALNTQSLTFSYEFPIYTAQSTAIQVFLTESLLKLFFELGISGFGVGNSTVKSTAANIYKSMTGEKLSGVALRKKAGVLTAMTPFLKSAELLDTFNNPDELDSFLVGVLGSQYFRPVIDLMDETLLHRFKKEMEKGKDFYEAYQTCKGLGDLKGRAKKSRALNTLTTLFEPLVEDSLKSASREVEKIYKDDVKDTPLLEVLRKANRFFKAPKKETLAKQSTRLYSINKLLPQGIIYTAHGIMETMPKD